MLRGAGDRCAIEADGKARSVFALSRDVSLQLRTATKTVVALSAYSACREVSLDLFLGSSIFLGSGACVSKYDNSNNSKGCTAFEVILEKMRSQSSSRTRA